MIPVVEMVFSILAVILPVAVYSHGRLTVPATRNPVGYENDPIGFGGRSLDQFVCRNDPNGSRTTVTAGQPLTMKWRNTAAHVGDCAVYVGYGDDLVNGGLSERRSGQFVKIANVFDCKSYSEQDYQIDLPSWLPAGKAVIRWEWYALHVRPTIEFYAQCADVDIVSSSSLTPADLPSYSIVDPEWVLPANANEGVGYRNAFDDSSNQYVTGPPCAFPGDSTSRNACALTAEGTQGYIAVGEGPMYAPDGDSGAAPTPNPVAAPVTAPTPEPTVSVPAPTDSVYPPVESPTTPPAPVESPTMPPVASPTSPPAEGECAALWAKCDGKNNDGSIFERKCCPSGAFCNRQDEWYSQCITGTCPTQAWEQCGGADLAGPSCCPEHHYCQPMNDGSSQCVPDEKKPWFQGDENVLCKN